MPTDAGTFAEAKVRLAKIAQYIAIFRLTAVAPYLSVAKRKAAVGCWHPPPLLHLIELMLYCIS